MGAQAIYYLSRKTERFVLQCVASARNEEVSNSTSRPGTGNEHTARLTSSLVDHA